MRLLLGVRMSASLLLLLWAACQVRAQLPEGSGDPSDSHTDQAAQSETSVADQLLTDEVPDRSQQTLRRFSRVSGDGSLIARVPEIQPEASQPEQQLTNEVPDKSDEMLRRFGRVSGEGESTTRVPEKTNSLTSEMDENNGVKELRTEIKLLTFMMGNIDFKRMLLKTRVDRLEDQLDQMSDRLDHTEVQMRDLLTPPARDCSDLPAGSESGVHLLQPGTAGRPPVRAFCDLDSTGGNWTVIQRRADLQPRQDFYRSWADYRAGFGELTAEFWWGLDNLWAVTSAADRQYELRIDLENSDGQQRHAVYQNFRVSSESDGYRLTVADYRGDAGDSLGGNSGQRFSTRDRDQDLRPFRSCARRHRAGWWFSDCGWSSLNGKYLSGRQRQRTSSISWNTFWTPRKPLRSVTMKIRPISEKQQPSEDEDDEDTTEYEETATS